MSAESGGCAIDGADLSFQSADPQQMSPPQASLRAHRYRSCHPVSNDSNRTVRRRQLSTPPTADRRRAAGRPVQPGAMVLLSSLAQFRAWIIPMRWSWQTRERAACACLCVWMLKAGMEEDSREIASTITPRAIAATQLTSLCASVPCKWNTHTQMEGTSTVGAPAVPISNRNQMPLPCRIRHQTTDSIDR